MKSYASLELCRNNLNTAIVFIVLVVVEQSPSAQNSDRFTYLQERIAYDDRILHDLAEEKAYLQSQLDAMDQERVIRNYQRAILARSMRKQKQLYAEMEEYYNRAPTFTPYNALGNYFEKRTLGFTHYIDVGHKTSKNFTHLRTNGREQRGQTKAFKKSISFLQNAKLARQKIKTHQKEKETLLRKNISEKIIRKS